ncbi:hypothetical protein H2248_007588 [Termitomyces sp. 'cryptogamus']|nr:hypothetical protein H2248_007588 [Termitomyces sp. 'cryptogamus']
MEELHNDRCKSVIYRVRCKTGRLRNRHLALKKLSEKTCPTATSLHQALHHPNIVSLLSAFSTNQDNFHVLELCSIGDLSNFLDSRPQPSLTESELRGVTKNLADALVYLRRELIVHGDINPSNVLLTSDYGVKLSNFKHSVRLQGNTHATESNFPISNYTPPEIAFGSPFSFSADVWSLGCVILYCLTGLPPIEAGTKANMQSRITQTIDRLSEDVSNDIKALISRTLQLIPENRIYIPDILSHVFLASDMPVKSLRPTASVRSNTCQKSYGELSSTDLNIRHRFDKSSSSRLASKTARHASDNLPQTSHSRLRLALADIGNIDMRTGLSNDIASCKATRRVVSDPARRTTVLSPFKTLKPYFETSATFPLRGNVTAPALRITSSRLESEASQVVTHGTVDAVSEITHGDQRGNIQEHPVDKKAYGQQPVEINREIPTLPIGTERPTPLNTQSMTCQIHKTIYGQITVLPSHSLLVDFRESQRRKGFKGDEVFLIDPDGLKVSVYSAPHLSSPSCLIEPIHQFSLQSLPSTYWKQYNDTARLVDQIKQRTPSLVVYLKTTKCTLMANSPQADIELLTSLPVTSGKIQADGHVLRIRLSRHNQSLEIARHVSDSQGEEWTKKIIASTLVSPYISTEEWKKLEKDEEDALHQLTLFASISDMFEELMTKVPAPSAPETSLDSKKDVADSREPVQSSLTTHVATAFTNSISSFNLAPRPSKLSTSFTTPDLTHNNTVFSEDAQFSKAEGIDPDTKASWRENADFTGQTPGRDLQTRFIPSVGWCIRYASNISQGGRYRLMFFDGTALDIDVDEDWVEFKSQSGETTVYNIRECASRRKIGDRMKVFEEFVSLFDDNQPG